MHMGIVTLIIFMFFGAILLLNYKNLNRNSDMMLDRIFEPAPFAQENIAPPVSDTGSARMPGRPKGNDAPIKQARFSPIFTVELDDDNNAAGVDSLLKLDDEFIAGIVKAALSKHKEMAIIAYGGEYFKFKIGGRKIVFLDISKEMQMFTNTIYTFLWIAVPLLLVLFLISLYFANRSIKPIEASYNRQKEFIADASHELKTPLAVISTNVDMLMDGADGEQKKWLSYIKQETERMADLTGSLLYLTKLDYVQESSTETVFDFGKLLENVLMPFDAVFYESKINVQTIIAPGIKIKGDSAQLRRLVGILIDNAVKYTDGTIKITLEKTPSEAKLTVCNTGKGIAAGELEKIWDRFYRGDKSRANTGGFGLGLPIAKAIAQRHKGSITAESAEDEWTRFILKLPLE